MRRIYGDMRQTEKRKTGQFAILAGAVLALFAILLFALLQTTAAETVPDDFYISGLPEYAKSIGEISLQNGKADAQVKDGSVHVVLKKDGSDMELSSEAVSMDEKLNLSDFVKDPGSYALTVTGTWIQSGESGSIETPFSKTTHFTYDKSAPEVSITGVKDQEITNQSLKIRLNAKDDYALSEDESRVTLKKDAEDAKEITGGEFTVSDEGEYALSYSFSDKAGNKTEGTLHFEIDKTAPKISVSAAKTNWNVKSIFGITAEMDDKNPEEISIKVENGDKTLTGTSKTKKAAITDSEGNYESEKEDWKVTVTAKDKAGNVAEKTYPVIRDNVAPSVSFSGVTDKAYYNRDVRVTMSAQDSTLKTEEMKTTRTADGKTSEVSGNEFSEEGKYTVTGTAEDKAGNKIQKQISFTIDKTVPKVSFDGLKKDAHYKGPDKLDVESNEAGSMTVEVRRDGDVIETKKADSKTTLKNFDKDGDYQITAKATDRAGNVSKEGVFTFVKDSTKPKVSIDGVQDGKFYNKTQTVNFSSVERYYKTNRVKVRIVRTTRNGETEVPFSFGSYAETSSQSYSAGKEGRYDISISAVDEAGNEAEEKEVRFTVDKTPPKTELSGIEKNKHYRKTPTLRIAANEPGTVCGTIKRDGKTVKTFKGKNSLSVSSFGKDGDYEVTAYSIDRAKNRGKIAKITFVKDSTAPVISLSGVNAGKFYNTRKNVRIGVTERYYKTDKVSITGYRVLRGKKTPLSKKFSGSGVHASDTFTAAETGTYYLEVNAKDEAGNVAQKKSVRFTVDTKNPVIKINISKKENGYHDRVAPSIQIDDDYMKDKSITLTRTGGTKPGTVNMAHSDRFNGTGGKRTYSDFEKLKVNDGLYTLKVTAADRAGNTSTETRTFVVDRFGSVFKIKNIPKEYYMKTMPDDIEIEEINVAKIKSYKAEIRKDGELMDDARVHTSKSGNHTIYRIAPSNFDEDGVYTVNLVTKDAAGNTSESKKAKKGKIKFAIDNAAPIIRYDGVESGDLIRKKIANLKVSATDTTSKATVSVTVNGEETPIKDGVVTLHEGFNQTVVITATDEAGNTATKKLNGISVSDSPFANLIANKLLLGGVIAGALLIVGGIGLLIRKKRKNVAEDRDKNEIIF